MALAWLLLRARRLPLSCIAVTSDHPASSCANGPSLRRKPFSESLARGRPLGSYRRQAAPISRDNAPLQVFSFNKINQWVFALVQERESWGLGGSTRRRRGTMKKKAHLSRFLSNCLRWGQTPSPQPRKHPPRVCFSPPSNRLQRPAPPPLLGLCSLPSLDPKPVS